MLNSQNYVKDVGVIRSGEVIASDVNLKDPDVKTFYHQVAGACTFLPDGSQLTFVGGQYSTKNPDILAHLNAIVDKQGTLVYSRKPGSPIPKEALDVAAEVAEPAGNAAELGKVHATPQMKAAIVAQVNADKPTAAKAVDPALVEAQK